jgi:hypothetical protein
MLVRWARQRYNAEEWLVLSFLLAVYGREHATPIMEAALNSHKKCSVFPTRDQARTFEMGRR